MSIFDDVKQAVASETGSDDAMAGHVVNMVKDPQNGGLEGMLQQLRQNGLAGAVDSWVGREANKAISPEEIEKALGQSRIGEIASKFGISPQEASQKLAKLLPSVIDKLTPEGKVQAA